MSPASVRVDRPLTRGGPTRGEPAGAPSQHDRHGPSTLRRLPLPANPADGARICRSITRHYARTFYFASHCLPRTTREHAYALYGFCRWADNQVDDAVDPAAAPTRLNRVRQAIDEAYAHSPSATPPPGLLAFRRATQACAIPRHLFDELVQGLAMDLTIQRYPDFNALETYCYRVAGVVGLMMTHVLGYRHERCFPHAVALGNAMQLTNILRDVREDLERGRVYLPQDELAHFGVSEQQLHDGRVDDSFRALMRFQIDRARQCYAEAEAGIPDLIGATSRLTVRVMGTLYGDILNAIEHQELDVFRQRASVPTSRKIQLLTHCHAAMLGESLGRFWR